MIDLYTVSWSYHLKMCNGRSKVCWWHFSLLRLNQSTSLLFTWVCHCSCFEPIFMWQIFSAEKSGPHCLNYELAQLRLILRIHQLAVDHSECVFHDYKSDPIDALKIHWINLGSIMHVPGFYSFMGISLFNVSFENINEKGAWGLAECWVWDLGFIDVSFAMAQPLEYLCTKHRCRYDT